MRRMRRVLRFMKRVLFMLCLGALAASPIPVILLVVRVNRRRDPEVPMLVVKRR